jgi:2-hydroxychromene-2-carboxylate isomerase
VKPAGAAADCPPLENTIRLQFFYSIASRYSYLASTQVDRLRNDTGIDIDWQPLTTGGLMKARGPNPFDGSAVSGQYEWAYREADAKRWAAMYGAPYREPRGRIQYDPELIALAANAGVLLHVAEALSRELFAALFVDDLHLIDEAECVRRAARCGIPDDVFIETLRAVGTADVLAQRIQHARSLGVFGLPSFVVGDTVFWGNDRLPLLKHHLDTLRGGTAG